MFIYFCLSPSLNFLNKKNKILPKLKILTVSYLNLYFSEENYVM